MIHAALAISALTNIILGWAVIRYSRKYWELSENYNILRQKTDQILLEFLQNEGQPLTIEDLIEMSKRDDLP